MTNQFTPHVITSSNQSLESVPELLSQVSTHKLVLLRGFTALEKEQLLAFCQSLGALLSWDFGPVMEMRVNKDTKNYLFTEGDVPLHWDGAFYQEPRFLVFHCIQAPLPDAGGETVFVDTESVWENLDEKTKALWKRYQLTFSTEKLAHYGGNITRNLVNKHPERERTILRFAEPVGEDYLNPVDVSIVNKNHAESEAILTEIREIMRHRQYCYAHTWQTGDYLIADNRSLLHGRNAFNAHSPRHLRRIQIL
ncbi:MAG: TauD/TfdA family dioxygenase [Legionella sp.]|nr:TauD/TfdA family dioxygenase [Legionella sp.]